MRAVGIWERVDRLLDTAPSISGLQFHGLHLLAAHRMRSQERPVPRELVAEERTCAILTMVAPLVLERVRAAYDGPLILIKGPEVAALYPDPGLRPFSDLDVLTDQPEAAQAALIADGFVPIGREDEYYADRHHLRPLQWPAFPLVVELHRRPEWLSWGTPPSFGDLLEEAVPARLGVDGFLAPSSPAHALIVTAHSWSESPLRRALDLIDALALAEGLDDEVEELARRWQMEGVWKTTRSAAEGVLGGRRPWSLRLWARDLPRATERSVLANHIRPLAGASWALSPRKALGVISARLSRIIRPAPGEDWSARTFRIGRALRDAFRNLGEHNVELAEGARRTRG